jgi:hypothetical protein
MVTDKKYALAPCSGMSPYGLITRASCSDIVNERDDLISICMGATSADREGFRELIRKYPISRLMVVKVLALIKFSNRKVLK